MTGDQLLCIVTPLGGVAPQRVAEQLRASQAALDALFRAHGQIHYATFTLLPPSPQGAPRPSGPALSLTLAIDAELRPADVIARLVQLDAPTLCAVYAGAFPATGAAAASLSSFLLDAGHLFHATGGFVGARDRSVAQVHDEARLFDRLRAAAAALPRPMQSDPRDLAAALSREALADPAFTWARQPAPLSRWRAAVTPSWRRLGATGGHLVSIAGVGLLIGALALIGYAGELAIAWLNGWVGAADVPSVKDVFVAGGALGGWLRGTVFVLVALNLAVAFLVRIRQLPVAAIELTLALALLVFTLVLVSLLAVVALDSRVPSRLKAEWHVALSHIAFGVYVVVLSFVALAIAAACAAVALLSTPAYRSEASLVLAFAAVSIVGLVVLHAIVVGGVDVAAAWGLPGADALVTDSWGWQPADKAAIVVLALSALAVAAALWSAGELRALSKWLPLLNTPRTPRKSDPSRRLHQTAPSIDACEAAWVARTSVMVSLVELRRPAWFFAPLARFFLWLVTSLGWHFFSEGRLGSIGSIQYAHWHLIDKDRRMLFCANFDGDFGGYLDDFITGGLPLLNLFWRWTCLGTRPGLALGGEEFDAAPTTPRRFPRTRLFLFAGCWSEQQFKAYARDSMLPFQYHFAAYDLRLGAILRATRLRDALSAPRSLASDDIILRALES